MAATTTPAVSGPDDERSMSETVAAPETALSPADAVRGETRGATSRFKHVMIAASAFVAAVVAAPDKPASAQDARPMVVAALEPSAARPSLTTQPPAEELLRPYRAAPLAPSVLAPIEASIKGLVDAANAGKTLILTDVGRPTPLAPINLATPEGLGRLMDGLAGAGPAVTPAQILGAPLTRDNFAEFVKKISDPNIDLSWALRPQGATEGYMTPKELEDYKRGLAGYAEKFVGVRLTELPENVRAVAIDAVVDFFNRDVPAMPLHAHYRVFNDLWAVVRTSAIIRYGNLEDNASFAYLVAWCLETGSAEDANDRMKALRACTTKGQLSSPFPIMDAMGMVARFATNVARPATAVRTEITPTTGKPIPVGVGDVTHRIASPEAIAAFYRRFPQLAPVSADYDMLSYVGQLGGQEIARDLDNAGKTTTKKNGDVASFVSGVNVTEQAGDIAEFLNTHPETKNLLAAFDRMIADGAKVDLSRPTEESFRVAARSTQAYITAVRAFRNSPAYPELKRLVDAAPRVVIGLTTSPTGFDSLNIGQEFVYPETALAQTEQRLTTLNAIIARLKPRQSQ